MAWVWGVTVYLSDQWQMCLENHFSILFVDTSCPLKQHFTFKRNCAAFKKSLIMLKTYWPQDWHNNHPVVNKAWKKRLYRLHVMDD